MPTRGNPAPIKFTVFPSLFQTALFLAAVAVLDAVHIFDVDDLERNSHPSRDVSGGFSDHVAATDASVQTLTSDHFQPVDNQHSEASDLKRSLVPAYFKTKSPKKRENEGAFFPYSGLKDISKSQEQKIDKSAKIKRIMDAETGAESDYNHKHWNLEAEDGFKENNWKLEKSEENGSKSVNKPFSLSEQLTQDIRAQQIDADPARRAEQNVILDPNEYIHSTQRQEKGDEYHADRTEIPEVTNHLENGAIKLSAEEEHPKNVVEKDELVKHNENLESELGKEVYFLNRAKHLQNNSRTTAEGVKGRGEQREGASDADKDHLENDVLKDGEKGDSSHGDKMYKLLRSKQVHEEAEVKIKPAEDEKRQKEVVGEEANPEKSQRENSKKNKTKNKMEEDDKCSAERELKQLEEDRKMRNERIKALKAEKKALIAAAKRDEEKAQKLHRQKKLAEEAKLRKLEEEEKIKRKEIEQNIQALELKAKEDELRIKEEQLLIATQKLKKEQERLFQQKKKRDEEDREKALALKKLDEPKEKEKVVEKEAEVKEATTAAEKQKRAQENWAKIADFVLAKRGPAQSPSETIEKHLRDKLIVDNQSHIQEGSQFAQNWDKLLKAKQMHEESVKKAKKAAKEEVADPEVKQLAIIPAYKQVYAPEEELSKAIIPYKKAISSFEGVHNSLERNEANPQKDKSLEAAESVREEKETLAHPLDLTEGSRNAMWWKDVLEPVIRVTKEERNLLEKYAKSIEIKDGVRNKGRRVPLNSSGSSSGSNEDRYPIEKVLPSGQANAFEAVIYQLAIDELVEEHKKEPKSNYIPVRSITPPFAYQYSEKNEQEHRGLSHAFWDKVKARIEDKREQMKQGKNSGVVDKEKIESIAGSRFQIITKSAIEHLKKRADGEVPPRCQLPHKISTKKLIICDIHPSMSLLAIKELLSMGLCTIAAYEAARVLLESTTPGAHRIVVRQRKTVRKEERSRAFKKTDPRLIQLNKLSKDTKTPLWMSINLHYDGSPELNMWIRGMFPDRDQRLIFFETIHMLVIKGNFAGVIINWSYPNAIYDEHFCQFLREFVNYNGIHTNDQFAKNIPDYNSVDNNAKSEQERTLKVGLQLAGAAHKMFTKKADVEVLKKMEFVVVSPIGKLFNPQQEVEEESMAEDDPLLNFTNKEAILELLKLNIPCHKIIPGLAFYSYRANVARSFGYMCPRFDPTFLLRKVKRRRKRSVENYVGFTFGAQPVDGQTSKSKRPKKYAASSRLFKTRANRTRPFKISGGIRKPSSWPRYGLRNYGTSPARNNTRKIREESSERKFKRAKIDEKTVATEQMTDENILIPHINTSLQSEIGLERLVKTTLQENGDYSLHGFGGVHISPYHDDIRGQCSKSNRKPFVLTETMLQVKRKYFLTNSAEEEEHKS